MQMASSLVDINQGCTCKVRMLNPFPTAVSIKQDAVVGKAEPTEGKPKELVGQECPSEQENCNSVRRIALQEKEEKTAVPILSINKVVEDEKDFTRDIPVHLQELFQSTVKELKQSQKARIAKLLIEFKDTFSKDEWDLTHLTEHSIPTGEAAPIKQPPRRVLMAYAANEKKAIEDLKAKGVIRDSTSPWASPIVLVDKKDGVRPCVDYRKLNQLVKPDGFPMPRADRKSVV